MTALTFSSGPHEAAATSQGAGRIESVSGEALRHLDNSGKGCLDIAGTGTIGEGEVQPREEEGPSGLLGCLNVLQVLVVHNRTGSLVPSR